MRITQIFKKDYIVGIDIGASSVKVAQFKKKKDGLLSLVKADLREVAHTEGSPPSEEAAVSALKDLLKGVDLQRSKFIVAINCPKTYTRKVTAPYMPKSELAEGIKLEAKNYFPISLEDSFLDFEILGEATEKDIKKYQLLVATSAKKTVERYLSILKKCGIKPFSFITTPLAVQKIIEPSLSQQSTVTATLDIGGHFTELAIFSQGSLLFSRKIPVAGSDFTKAITGVLISDRGKTELSLDEAEKIKREIGIPAEGESKIIADKISTAQILAMLRSPLEQLVNEMGRSFDYYREEAGGGKVDRLILLGAGASLKGLTAFLGNELGMDVKVEDKWGHRLALAIGTALNEGKGINLLPAEIKEQTKQAFKRAGVKSVAIATALILAFIYIGMKIQLANYQKRISVARLELSALQDELNEAKEKSVASGVLRDEPYWDDVFKELSNIIPDEIYLTSLAVEKRSIILKGVAYSSDPDTMLSSFIISLEKGLFKNVKLVTSSKMKDKPANEFELRCWVD